MSIVLQKFISDSGLCSRRQAEELIRQGKVFVNGEKAELGYKVDTELVESGKLIVETRHGASKNKKIELANEKIYIKLNKPKGYVCTNAEFKGEKSVFDLLPASVETRRGASLHSVGRLDKNSRGLVLLTNDGELTQKMTHPKFEHEKEYIVEISNSKKQDTNYNDIVLQFKRGINIGADDGIVRVQDMKYLGDSKFKIILTEGKKRQIRRMFRMVGCEVVDLVRTRIGDIRLGNLAEGKWEYIKIKK